MSATPSTPEPPAVDRAEALRFLTLLAEDDYQHVTFQTFDDSDAKRGSLARILHAGVRGVYEELVALNADGAGVFVTVNRTDHKGRSAETSSASAPCSSTSTARRSAPCSPPDLSRISWLSRARPFPRLLDRR